MEAFVERYPFASLKVKTCSTMSKKLNVKAANDKVITINADRDLFGRLLIAANARQINLKEVLHYELAPISCALAQQDGSLRKTTKSVLSTIIEEEVNVIPQLLASARQTIFILDGMATVQVVKASGASTLGDLSLKYFDIFTAPLSLRNCNCSEVQIVFDQYKETSVKPRERASRGASTALEVQISSRSTPVPKQWGKYTFNPQNKENLCDYLTKSMCKIAQEKLPAKKNTDHWRKAQRRGKMCKRQ